MAVYALRAAVQLRVECHWWRHRATAAAALLAAHARQPLSNAINELKTVLVPVTYQAKYYGTMAVRDDDTPALPAKVAAPRRVIRPRQQNDSAVKVIK